VPDARFAELRRLLSDVEILELTFIACTYEMSATMSRALRLEFDDRPDPVVEVAAPSEVAP
jgi:alkylhydroperoxidase family enzyme